MTVRTLAVLLLALVCAAGAHAQDLRDPPGQSFTVWPNIPVIRAADLADYEGDRKLFDELHAVTHVGITWQDGRCLLDVVVNWQARRWRPPAPRSEWIGFDAQPGAVNDPGVIAGLQWLFIAAPVTLLLVSALVLRIYPLTPEKHAEIRRGLEARHD